MAAQRAETPHRLDWLSGKLPRRAYAHRLVTQALLPADNAPVAEERLRSPGKRLPVGEIHRIIRPHPLITEAEVRKPVKLFFLQEARRRSLGDPCEIPLTGAIEVMHHAEVIFRLSLIPDMSTRTMLPPSRPS